MEVHLEYGSPSIFGKTAGGVYGGDERFSNVKKKNDSGHVAIPLLPESRLGGNKICFLSKYPCGCFFVDRRGSRVRLGKRLLALDKVDGGR